jgi:hypothetical protein
MKIIFSRKGFDSATGGMPSPIFPDDTFCSLPIPSNEKPKLEDIRFNGEKLSRIIGQLTGENVAKIGVHLDPDLNRDAYPRKTGWLPCFGQIGTAQSHLEKQKVCEGDLFLFFGWFRKVDMVNGKLRYCSDAQDIHALFGWLQIGTIYHPGGDGKEPPKWASYHPHVRDKDRRNTSNNTLYIASKRLHLPGLKQSIAGGGIFNRFAPSLQLTEPGRKRSIWRLPSFFYPVKGFSPLSYHSDMSRWRKDKNGILLQTIGRGQEFVLDCEFYPKVFSWLKDIFQMVPPIGSSRESNK